MTTPRFAVDKMLGRLTTWLRLIGYDTTYGSHLAGQTLIRHARAEGRVILTRDRRLLRARQCPPLLFVDSDHFREQFRQVIEAYQLDPHARLFTRCIRCNTPLIAVAKEHVAASVPPYVLATQTRFLRCPRCARIYWPGTHLDRVRDDLQTMGVCRPSNP